MKGELHLFNLLLQLDFKKKGMEKKDLDFLPQVLSITFAFVNESRVV